MDKKSTVNVRINKNLKYDGKQILKAMGLNPTMAIKIFLEECLDKKKLPFVINYFPLPEYAENDSVLQVKIDAELKANSMDTLKSNGLTLSEAVNLLYRQIVTSGKLPF